MSEFVPGCFGSAVSFDADDDICKECAMFRPCMDKAGETLMEIRKHINIDKAIEQHNMGVIKAGAKPVAISYKGETRPATTKARPLSRRVEELDEEALKVLERITSKKPREQAERLLKRGLSGRYMRKVMREGFNPFYDGKPRFMQIACDFLIKGGYAKSELAGAFQEVGMSKTTAYSHVAIATAILIGMEAAIESRRNGRVVMSSKEV